MIKGPITVERHDQEDGSIIYEIWDNLRDSYHMITSISERDNDNARMEANLIQTALTKWLEPPAQDSWADIPTTSWT